MRECRMRKEKQMSESFPMGALLAVAGGFLDVYTYIIRGGVFANAQTGNIVLLAFHLAQWNPVKVIYYLIPVLAFMAGVFCTEFIRDHFQRHPVFHWRQITIGAEILILFFVAFLPQGNWNVVANVFISFICAIQVESFRKVNGNAYATTMCTGNLRSGTELLYRYFVKKKKEDGKKAFQYYGIIFYFIIGAIAGGFFTWIFLEKAVLFCCLILFCGFIMMFLKGESSQEKEMDSWNQ